MLIILLRSVDISLIINEGKGILYRREIGLGHSTLANLFLSGIYKQANPHN